MPLTLKQAVHASPLITLSQMPVGSIAIMRDERSTSLGNYIYRTRDNLVVDLEETINIWRCGASFEDYKVELISVGTTVEFTVTN